MPSALIFIAQSISHLYIVLERPNPDIDLLGIRQTQRLVGYYSISPRLRLCVFISIPRYISGIRLTLLFHYLCVTLFTFNDFLLKHNLMLSLFGIHVLTLYSKV